MIHWSSSSIFRSFGFSNLVGWLRLPEVASFPAPVDGPLAWHHLGGGGFTSLAERYAGSRRIMPSGVRLSSVGANAPEEPPALPGDMESLYHVPVMPREVVEWINPEPGKLLMDCTFGGGGHTRRMLAGGAGVLALDRDADAMGQAQELSEDWPEDLVPLRTSFDHYPEILSEAGVYGVDGILMDVGVSSWQIDSPNRGFSFRFDGPLDMRMDRDAPLTAADIVNAWTVEELTRIFFDYGEERASRRVAQAIEKRRAVKTIMTTGQLAELVATVIPKHSGQHPAAKIFQALRIAVNDELGCLERALAEAHHWLRPGGRLVVLTFHSLEDRLVKNYMRRHSEPFVDRPEWPAPRPNTECHYRLPVRKAITASDAEQRDNPRSRCARLRVAERIS